MVNDKNHLYSKEDYQKDLKTIDKIKASQGFSRFSTSAATALNDAGNTQAPEAMQIATRDGHFRPINDTFGSFGPSTIEIFFGTKPSGGRSWVTYNIFEITGDVTFAFTGTPIGKMLPFTLEITINTGTPPVITWPASLINPPNLTGLLTNGAVIVLHFETVQDTTSERQIFIGGNSNFGGGGGSQTPWLSDIDADGYDLFDLSNLIFREGVLPNPAGVLSAIYVLTSDMHFNVAAGNTFVWDENAIAQMTLSGSSLLMDSVDLDMNSNIITRINDAVWIQDAVLPISTVDFIAATGTLFIMNADSGNSIDLQTGKVSKLLISPSSATLGINVDLNMASNDILNGANIFLNADTTHTIDFTRITAQADPYTIGSINWRHDDQGGIPVNYAGIDGIMVTDAVAANEEGAIEFRITRNGQHDYIQLALNQGGNNWIHAHDDIDMNTNDIFQVDRVTLSTTAAASSTLDKGLYSMNANGGVGINSPIDALGSKFSVLEEEVEKFTVDHVGDNVLVIDYTFNVNDSVAGNNYSINHLSVNTLISAPNKITYNVGAANQYEQTDGLITFIGAKGIIANIDQLGFRTLGNIIQDSGNNMVYDSVPTGSHLFGDGTLTYMDLNTSRAIFDDFYFEFLSRTSPGVTGVANKGRLFMDSANSHHVSVIRNGSVIDLEGGGVQTPWASDIDGATFDLRNISNLEFTNPSTLVPAGTIHAIYVDATNDLSYNAIASNFHNFRVNAVSQMTISASVIDFQGNSVIDGVVDATITGVSGITGLGTQGQNLAMGNFNVTGVNQIAFNEANQTITDNVNGMRFSLPDAADTYDYTINTKQTQLLVRCMFMQK
jgi:hypothetical protein